MYFHDQPVFPAKDVGGGQGGGGHGWLLGNNNALLTDWKVSLSLALFSLKTGRILPAVAQQQLFESPVALVTAAAE